MIFDTITAIADYLNNGKFDNSASRKQCEAAIREFLRTDHETLTVDGKIILNNELERFSCFTEAIQYRTPRSEYEREVSNYESSSSSSSSSGTVVPTEPFQIEINIEVENQHLQIWYGDAIDFTIDWGDGNIDIVQGGVHFEDYIEHIYSNLGMYIVSMSGQTSGLKIYDERAYQAEDYAMVTRVLTPLNLVTGLTDLTEFLYYNWNLTSIPSGLFDNCTNVTSFEYAFSTCRNLTSIPSGLFDGCPNATDFIATFENCRNLTSIPSGLFDNCSNVTSFYSAFTNCRDLASIPSGLFDNCLNVTNFEYAFANCQDLASIPSGLFDGCPNVTNFTSVFDNCLDLASIPSGLFDGCPNVTNFNAAFFNCISLTGNAPELWLRVPEPTGENCFYNDSGLTNYFSIPDNWNGVS